MFFKKGIEFYNSLSNRREGPKIEEKQLIDKGALFLIKKRGNNVLSISSLVFYSITIL